MLPLSGVMVLEVESIGPGPFAAMVLADLGANVLRIGRPGSGGTHNPVLDRGRAGRLPLDLKADADVVRFKSLLSKADVLIEGYRPGVMERLGLGPESCLQVNPDLIYGRITGWGREGPLAQTAGHDINYIALSGALFGMGTEHSGPTPPLNLVGDFGGGGMLLAVGILAALFGTTRGRRGQVVDTAMLHGSSLLMAMMYGMKATGRWKTGRAQNILDGSAYFYRCYRCADGGWVAVGAIEEPFRRELFKGLGLIAEAEELLKASATDPSVHATLEKVFAQHPRAEWERRFAATDACVTPVLDMDEAAIHPQNQHTFLLVDGVIHPRPAPVFGAGTLPLPAGPLRDAQRAWGLDGL